MGVTPARPDTQRHPDERPKAPIAAAAWIAVALVAGVIAVLVVANTGDRSGPTPPTSMFAAAGIVMSVIGFVTVLCAARSAGVASRAAIALAGGLAVIAAVKFAFGPISMFAARSEIQDPLGLGSGGNTVAIAAVVTLLYAGAVLALGAWLRPRGWTTWPPAATATTLLLLGVGTLVGGAVLTNAPLGYVGDALTGVEATAIVTSLFVAATLVAAAFRDTAEQARAIGTASTYVSIVWVAIAFVLLFHVLWVVFILAVVTLWPLRTVTPK